MMLKRQFRKLRLQHSAISKEIEAEQNAVRPDRVKLLRLKRIRLALMDHMKRLVAKISDQELQRLTPLYGAQRAMSMGGQEAGR